MNTHPHTDRERERAVGPDCVAAERAAQNLFASMETKTGALFVPFSHVLALVYSFCAFFASPNVAVLRGGVFSLRP